MLGGAEAVAYLDIDDTILRPIDTRNRALATGTAA